MTNTPTADMVAADWSRMMNRMNNDANVAAFAEAIATDHRTLVQKSVAAMLTAICRVAEDAVAGRYDARNETSVQVCAAIRDHLREWDDLRVFPIIVNDDNVVKLPYI